MVSGFRANSPVLASPIGTITYSSEFPMTPSIFEFDFDVSSVGFVHGGNSGDIAAKVRDGDGLLLGSLYQAGTFDDEPAGPATLGGPGIRKLLWFETAGSFAPLDNIVFTTSMARGLSRRA